MKTASVALVLCLNLGVDPPDTVRTHPSALLQCWIDPFALDPAKALEVIGRQLQAQYERLQPRARYKQCLDPTVEDVKKLCLSLRRSAKAERVVFHYNGHGVPKPTNNGEIWVFNKNYTQYIPLSIYELQSWMGTPSIYVFDCSNAGLVVKWFLKFAAQRERKRLQVLETASANAASGGGSGEASPGSRASPSAKRPPPDYVPKDTILLAACSMNEVLPTNPDLPADAFTSCLTTPIKVALRYAATSPLSSVPFDILERIPGRMSDRKTPLGELNWIFTSITDTIAWNILPRDMFQRLFRQDLMVASLFRNFLLAERVLRAASTTPVSVPAMPSTFSHPMWQSWDLASDQTMMQFAVDSGGSVDFHHSSFFADQLTAFEVWLSPGELGGMSPEQLPIVLQVLLSQAHRLRALRLLGRFFDLGPWAVNLALSVGIFPYVLKLLQSPVLELRSILVFIWTKLLSLDKSCQLDLVKDNGHNYFLQVLSSQTVPPDQRAQAAFVLTCVANRCRPGQSACLASGLLRVALTQINESNALLRRWCLLCLAKLWEAYDDAKYAAIEVAAHERVCGLLTDAVPEVRAAAVYALATFFGGGAGDDKRRNIELNLGLTVPVVINDGSQLVRAELVHALAALVQCYPERFAVAAQELRRAHLGLDVGGGGGAQSVPMSTSGLVGTPDSHRPTARRAPDHPSLRPPGASPSRSRSNERSRDSTDTDDPSPATRRPMGRSPIRGIRSVSSDIERELLRGESSEAGTTTDEDGRVSGAESDDDDDGDEGETDSDASGGFDDGASGVFVTVWRFILLLAADPLPQIASMAGNIVERVSGESRYLGITSPSRFVGPTVPSPLPDSFVCESVAIMRKLEDAEAPAPPGPLNSAKAEAKRKGIGLSSRFSLRRSSGVLREEADAAAATPASTAAPTSSSLAASSSQQDDGALGNRAAAVLPLSRGSSMRRTRAGAFLAGSEGGGGGDDDASSSPSSSLDPGPPPGPVTPVIRSTFYEWSSAHFASPLYTEATAGIVDETSPLAMATAWRAHYNEEILLRLRNPHSLERRPPATMDEQIASLSLSSSPATALLFHPFDDYLMVANAGDRLSAFSWRDGSCFQRFSNTSSSANDRITAMEFLAEDTASHGPILMTGTADGVVRVWRNVTEPSVNLVSTWRALPSRRSGGKGGSGLVCSWQERNGLLLAGGDVSSLRCWDLQSELCIDEIQTGTQAGVTSLESDKRGGRLVAAGCGDGTVRLFDYRVPPHYSCTAVLRGHDHSIVNVGMLRTDNRVVSASANGEVRFWDPRQTDKALSSFAVHGTEDEMTCFTVHEWLPLVACGSSNQRIRILNFQGAKISTIKYSEGFLQTRIGRVLGLRFHPNAPILAAATSDKVVHVYR
jgi:regulator-associated protein of mTOR